MMILNLALQRNGCHEILKKSLRSANEVLVTCKTGNEIDDMIHSGVYAVGAVVAHRD